jgi:hypothetical protein
MGYGSTIEAHVASEIIIQKPLRLVAFPAVPCESARDKSPNSDLFPQFSNSAISWSSPCQGYGMLAVLPSGWDLNSKGLPGERAVEALIDHAMNT